MKTKKRIFLCLLLSFFCLAMAIPTTASNADAPAAIEWTQEEQEFIQEHPEIRLGVDPAFVPYEFFDTDGVYKGIAADYIALISKKTGLKMTVEKGLTWAEAYEKAVEKELDVLPCIANTQERGKYFLFSEGYFTFQRVIFINEDNKQIKSFDDLQGKRVAVQTNSSHHSFMLAYDSISLSLYPTVEEALQAVSDGTEIAFVGNLSTSSYLAKMNGITKLRYITIYTEKPQTLHFAVRNDWPILVSIIDKALGSVKEEEKIAINNKWISIQEDADYSGIIRIVSITGAVIALVLAVSFFWIVRLRREIAKRRKAQEEMHAAKEEAEQANQVKSLFLARMSHEIRTPLSAIMGMSYLMKKAGLTATQGIYLDKLNQAARNMLGIINDILDFSKIESGKIEIEKISFDLDKLLQRITNIISVKVEEKDVEFIIQKEPDMPASFLGDPTRIEQVLLNIVNNAVKFTERGTVSLSVHTVSKEGKTHLIEFRVKDTGIGMQEEQVKRLFVPFDQGDSSISRRFGGTGLGLSIVKSLTDLMGGQVEVQSVFRKGSTFTIRLPLEVDVSKEQVDAKKMAANCFDHIRALVLDKSENARTMLADCLKAFGIASKLTASEDEAIQIMRKAALEGDAPYNLLIVDFMTPQDGGIAFLDKVKKSMYFQKTSKCMLMVPMTREDLFEEITASGIDFGITKPLIPSALYNGIVEMFKIKPPQVEEVSKSQDSLTAPYPYSILLVEDNKTNQFIAQTILEQAGFRVSKADNGEAGYTFFADNRKEIDLILMDIHMPVMDGYTATDLIRKIDAEIPVIAMTADAVIGVEEKCKSHGIDHYVSKPFEPEQFIRTILDVLKGRKCRAAKEASAGDTPMGNVDSVEPVLDTADGIRRIGGDAEIYHAILKEYYEENKLVAEDLKSRIDAKDYTAAVQIVHKIKSSSGSIGAKSLNEAAAKLQKSLQASEEEAIDKGQVQFQSLLGKVLEEITAILKV